MKIGVENKRARGFQQHGIVFKTDTDTQFCGICVWCGRDRFYANKETLLWDCKVCAEDGDFSNFLKRRSEDYQENAEKSEMLKLAKDRGIRPQTLKAWRVGFSKENKFFSIPVDGNPKQRMTDLRRYEIGKRSIATSGAKLSFVIPRKLSNSRKIWLCEGEFDGMALWEALRKLGIGDDVFSTVGSGFPSQCVPMFQDKDVVVCFDADEAGRKSAQRVESRLKGIARNLEFIHWPEGTPDRFDIRDLYKLHSKNARETLSNIEKMLRDFPPKTLFQKTEAKAEAEDESHKAPEGKGLHHLEVKESYRKWLEMPDTECLDVLFGTCFANRLGGDPVWLFLVAPPGGMKSELCMSLRNGWGIFCLTSLTPRALVSGMVGPDGADPSLLPKLDGKLLVVKDFTTILNAPVITRDEIFGILRDCYDGHYDMGYGNNIVRRYDSKFGIVAGVTSSIETLSSLHSPLGERFLKYRLKTPRKQESVILKAIDNLKSNQGMQDELSEIGQKTLDKKIDSENLPDLDRWKPGLIALARLVARLRGAVVRDRYTGFLQFKPQAEIGTRLAKQLAKLAYGIAIFKDESEVSESTFETIIKVALDSAPDRVLEIVKQMYIKGNKGRDFHKTKEIAEWSRFPSDTAIRILQDLDLLRIVQKEKQHRAGWGDVWRLSPETFNWFDKLGVFKGKPRIIKKRLKIQKRKKASKLPSV